MLVVPFSGSTGNLLTNVLHLVRLILRHFVSPLHRRGMHTQIHRGQALTAQMLQCFVVPLPSVDVGVFCLFKSSKENCFSLKLLRQFKMHKKMILCFLASRKIFNMRSKSVVGVTELYTHRQGSGSHPFHRQPNAQDSEVTSVKAAGDFYTFLILPSQTIWIEKTNCIIFKGVCISEIGNA